ncbi:MAG: ABC transporter permease subunit [Planctomycetes bacterium]|nr:ABC transporter permease subunit [Planctomycetota bacterium]
MTDVLVPHDTLPPREAPTAPRPLAGFRALFGQAFREGWRRRRLVLLLLASIGIGALVGRLAVRVATRMTRWNDMPVDELLASQLWLNVGRFVVAMLFPLIALLLGSQGFSRLRSDRTLVYHLVRPVGRGTVFLARWLAGVPSLIAVSFSAVAATVLASGVALPVAGWLGLIGVTVVAMLVLSAVYFALSAVWRHGVIIGLIYTFVIEGLLATVPGTMQRASISHHVRAVLVSWVGPAFETLGEGVAKNVQSGTSDRDAENAVSFFGQTEYLDGPTALLVLLVIGAVFVLGGMYMVRRKDWPLKD